MEKRCRKVLRNAVFDAMRIRDGNDNAETSGADKLMAALVEFYHPYPSNNDLITVDNSTPEEIEIATNFFTEIFDLKKSNLELDSPDYIRSLRINASGLAYLRVELLPLFITPRHLRNRLLDILFYEDTVKTALTEAYSFMHEAAVELDDESVYPIGHDWWSPNYKRVRFETDPFQEYLLND